MHEEILKKLEESAEFKNWKKENKDSFLSHIIFFVEGDVTTETQVGFYNEKRNKVKSFTISEVSVTGLPEDEVFKREEDKVYAVDLKKIKIDLQKASDEADAVQKKNYPKHIPIKKIIVLQNINKDNLWNITYVTSNFQTLNIKIDAETGRLTEHKLVDLMQFGAKKAS